MLCLSIFSSCSICSLALLENGKIKMAKEEEKEMKRRMKNMKKRI
jgi:hypothetical protein